MASNNTYGVSKLSIVYNTWCSNGFHIIKAVLRPESRNDKAGIKATLALIVDSKYYTDTGSDLEI